MTIFDRDGRFLSEDGMWEENPDEYPPDAEHTSGRWQRKASLSSTLGPIMRGSEGGTDFRPEPDPEQRPWPHGCDAECPTCGSGPALEIPTTVEPRTFVTRRILAVRWNSSTFLPSV